MKDRLPGGHDVSIGDRGYWVESDSSLYVVKGTHAYGISLSGFDPTDPRQDMAIEIARRQGCRETPDAGVHRRP